MEGKILILCGKSACGKDTIYQQLLSHGFNKAISWTSRPIRPNEQDNREYHFCNKKKFEHLIKNDKLIEYRTYNTLVNNKPDTWYYGLDKSEIDLTIGNYCVIMDLEGANSLIKEYGRKNCYVVYIYAPLSTREQRCINRKDFNKYEWNRRANADNIDFSQDKINKVKNIQINNFSQTLQSSVNQIMEGFKEWNSNQN